MSPFKNGIVKALAALEKLPEVQSKYNLFTSIRDLSAVKQKVQETAAETSNLPLKGKLVAIKDNIATRMEATTCGSKILEHYTSPFDSTVAQLLEQSGSLIIGKTNLDEFGMGSGNTFSHFGPATNPLYPNEPHITGGSSGGSAAAVAAGVCDFSLGTDTGGSVRLPASYCSVVGFKPTYGRISRWGVVAYAQSLDTIGIMSKDISIVEQVFNVLNKYDDKDPTSLNPSQRTVLDSVPKAQTEKLTIGVPDEYNIKELASSATESWLDSLKQLQKAGHIIKQVSIPSVIQSVPVYYTLAPAEAASNLSRYDGIRYGYRSDKDSDKSGVLFGKTRSEGFGKEVQRRILLGNYSLSADAYNNHFLKAQKLRSQLTSEFNKVFAFPNISSSIQKENNREGVDIIITPTTMSPAPTLSGFQTKNKENFLTSYVNDYLTIPASLVGLPSISIPWHNGSSVPSSIQISGQFGDDLTVLEAAKILMNLNR